ncbi:MAG: saccharopine dehydrogenase, partial [Bacteroidetes bacterium]|nr:saccharopine dehydrogenase [Bacteroidota bacterium]MBU1677542.1 saccharopine dehydrogenase [Bacteroidota bacterium]
LMDFPGVGTLQAFNSDGLRSLLKTTDIPNMKEKTLRYPEHAEKIELLKNIGLFSKDYIELNSIKVKPIDLISKLLFPMWQMQSGDKDFTVLKVIIRGEKNNLNCQIEYLLIDYFDDETGIHSMARTTGYMAAMGVRLLADNLYSRKGICSPEFVGEDIASAKYILQGLAARNIRITEKWS